MSASSFSTNTPPAGLAFDLAASSYDETFTSSLIGRTQRNSVWSVLQNTFRAGDTVLELNCGTGEDALQLARMGVTVLACDASSEMVDIARRRAGFLQPQSSIGVIHLPTERVHELEAGMFDGVFSNFSGLNCIEDLPATAAALSRLVKPESQLLLCFSTRFCITEILYFLSIGRWRKAFRRCSGRTVAIINQHTFAVYYPTLRQLKAAFHPYFKLRLCVGVGVTVPPSYLEGWARRHPRVFEVLCRLESFVASLPGVRNFGDHILLRFERVSHVEA
jgi:ubiquinone/menaquinone biosynthesis C-methylase UbiE